MLSCRGRCARARRRGRRPPALVQEQVARDREEVGLDGGEVQPIPRVPHPDERLRHDVLGQVVIARQEQRKTVDVARVRLEQFREYRHAQPRMPSGRAGPAGSLTLRGDGQDVTAWSGRPTRRDEFAQTACDKARPSAGGWRRPGTPVAGAHVSRGCPPRRFPLSPSMHKYGDVLVPSGLSAERAQPTTCAERESWPQLRVEVLRRA